MKILREGAQFFTGNRHILAGQEGEGDYLALAVEGMPDLRNLCAIEVAESETGHQGWRLAADFYN